MRHLWLGLALGWLCGVAHAQPTADEITAAAARAVSYAQDHLAYRGGYLWWYQTDGSAQAGEGSTLVPRTTIWVQPPGTPAVGLAYVRLYDVTGDRRFLDAAVAAGEALCWGQTAPGGWYHYIHFAEPFDWHLHYLHEVEAGDTKAGKRKVISTFDDDTTQSALRLLLRLDHRLRGEHPGIRHAVEVALDAVLAAQYPCGAWPQVFRGPVPDQPILPAAIPDDYRQLLHIKEYWNLYTLNDDLLKTNVEAMLLAWRLRGDRRCLDSAVRAGEFLLRARLPQPHPVWAQQYDFDMQPAWARKFEMPAVTTLESVGALETLLQLWLETGEERWLEPVAPALAWFDRVRLPDGRWSRFHELGTNRPLYFNRKYEVTYSDDDLPTHYGFKQEFGDRLAAIASAVQRGRDAILADRQAPPSPGRLAELTPRVEAALASLDGQGRWVTMLREMRGRPLEVPREVIEMRVLVDNLTLLADYIETVRALERR